MALAVPETDNSPVAAIHGYELSGETIEKSEAPNLEQGELRRLASLAFAPKS
jgi:hypothetical protein